MPEYKRAKKMFKKVPHALDIYKATEESVKNTNKGKGKKYNPYAVAMSQVKKSGYGKKKGGWSKKAGILDFNPLLMQLNASMGSDYDIPTKCYQRASPHGDCIETMEQPYCDKGIPMLDFSGLKRMLQAELSDYSLTIESILDRLNKFYEQLMFNVSESMGLSPQFTYLIENKKIRNKIIEKIKTSLYFGVSENKLLDLLEGLKAFILNLINRYGELNIGATEKEAENNINKSVEMLTEINTDIDISIEKIKEESIVSKPVKGTVDLSPYIDKAREMMNARPFTTKGVFGDRLGITDYTILDKIIRQLKSEGIIKVKGNILQKI